MTKNEIRIAKIEGKIENEKEWFQIFFERENEEIALLHKLSLRRYEKQLELAKELEGITNTSTNYDFEGRPIS